MSAKKLTENEEQDQKGFFEKVGYDPDKFKADMDSKKVKDKKISMPGKPKERISFRTIIIIIGLILIILSSIFLLLTPWSEEKTIIDTDEYELYSAVLDSEELNYDYGPGSSYFDAGKLMAVSGSDLRNDLVLQNEKFKDFHFVIEIIDISQYKTHYTRSISNDSAIETETLPEESEEDITTIESSVNIFVREGEIHTAKLKVHIWSD